MTQKPWAIFGAHLGAYGLWLLAGAAAALLPASAALAQGQIWRCGNEYTNQPGERPEARGCRLLQGGNLSIVEGRRPTPPNPDAASAAAPSTAAPSAAPRTQPASSERPPSQRVERTEQQARDRDARLILETELRRAQERVRELQAEFNQGRPQPLPHERGDAARLQERTEELRRRLERAQGDVTAIEREIRRLPPVPAAASAAAGASAAAPAALAAAGASGASGASTGQFIKLPVLPTRPAAPATSGTPAAPSTLTAPAGPR